MHLRAVLRLCTGEKFNLWAQNAQTLHVTVKTTSHLDMIYVLSKFSNLLCSISTARNYVCRGDLAGAMKELQAARTSCPRNKPNALVKIQRFINLIESQDKCAASA